MQTDVPAPFRLDGRVAIVTGASSGLGARFAQVLHGAGATVVLAARRADRLRSLADDLADRVHVIGCDIAVAEQREALVAQAVSLTGRLDVLVNNAGTARSVAADEEDVAQVREALEVNTVAPFHLCRLAAGAFGGRPGAIVNIASLIAYRSADRYPLGGYAASKAALVALTRELAAQWGSRGVRVNAIAPGWFPSEMNGMLADPAQVAWIERHTALGRHGAAHELDGALLFLAGDASTYVTGQTLIVDGGWSVY